MYDSTLTAFVSSSGYFPILLWVSSFSLTLSLKHTPSSSSPPLLHHPANKIEFPPRVSHSAAASSSSPSPLSSRWLTRGEDPKWDHGGLAETSVSHRNSFRLPSPLSPPFQLQSPTKTDEHQEGSPSLRIEEVKVGCVLLWSNIWDLETSSVALDTVESRIQRVKNRNEGIVWV